jgi:hypothetical protein
MNERIRELAHKSFDRYNGADGVPVAEFNHEKFAKFLILECANFTDPVTRKLMMKHFGVEE